MSKRALIIGGNGFIGGNLADKLIDHDWKVDIIDNCATSDYNKKRNPHIEHFWCEGWLSVNNAALDHDYERIYYLASYPSPKSYKMYPRETLKLGYEGVQKAISLAVNEGATLFLASSSEVYGNTNFTMSEKDNYGSVNTYGERSCYDESKRVMETLAYIYKDECKIRIGRIFNTYGPGMAMDGRVFTEFLKAAHNNTPIHIYRSPAVTRSPCYINDLLAQIEVLMQSDRSEPTNIGNDIEYTLAEIAELCKQVTNSSSEIEIDPNGTDKDDPLVRKPDLTVIRSLGYQDYQPYLKTSLKDGLISLYNYMKETVLT